MARFVAGRRREDGGFVEIAPMRRSGTNPTAAAVGTLQLARSDIADDVRSGVAGFLAEMPSFEGGLRANGRAPLADLLSTFTGAWTLEELGELDRIERRRCLATSQFAGPAARAAFAAGSGTRGPTLNTLSTASVLSPCLHPDPACDVPHASNT